MQIYSAGGAGINNAKQYSKWHDKTVAGFATLKTVFIDTSDRNFDELTPVDQCFQIEDDSTGEKLQGGGKVRRTNVPSVEAAIPMILQKFPPCDYNVVLHSTSGASGSIVAPLLVSELLSRGQAVIVIAIGSVATGIEVKNTLFTIASYQNIVEDRQLPVNMFYREMGPTKTRRAVDSEIVTVISVLAAMLSGENRELDHEDCRNFLNYSHAIKYPAKLGHLDIFEKDIVIDKGQYLISLMTLTDEDTSSESSVPVEYQATGFVNEAARKSLSKFALPLHAAIVSGFFASTEKRLEKLKEQFATNRELVSDKKVTTDVGQKSSKGLVYD